MAVSHSICWCLAWEQKGDDFLKYDFRRRLFNLTVLGGAFFPDLLNHHLAEPKFKCTRPAVVAVSFHASVTTLLRPTHLIESCTTLLPVTFLNSPILSVDGRSTKYCCGIDDKWSFHFLSQSTSTTPSSVPTPPQHSKNLPSPLNPHPRLPRKPHKCFLAQKSGHEKPRTFPTE